MLRRHLGLPLGTVSTLAGVAVLAAVAALPGAAVAGGAERSRPTNGFARWGVWNRPLPRDVPLAANSAAVVQNILLDEQNNYGGWAVNTDTYSTPIYRVG